MTTTTNDNHYHMTTTTTWQPPTCPVQSTPVTITRFYFARKSSPHDNHHHMTITTSWQPPPHICQPILLGKCLLTTILSEQAILWFDLYCIRCPNDVQTFLENFTIQSMVLVSGFMKNIEQENTHLMYFYMVNNKLDTLIEIIIFFWPWFRKQTVGIKFQLHGGCI